MATGVAWRLHRSGIPVVMTELPRPLTVRRAVAFAQAVYDDEHEVEGITARKALVADVPEVLEAGEIPVLVDPEAEAIDELAPSAVVDAVLAKTNTGTTLDSAAFVVALGPGFEAGVDCHAVIETNRGHNLGRAIWEGAAEADTGTARRHLVAANGPRIWRERRAQPGSRASGNACAAARLRPAAFRPWRVSATVCRPGNLTAGFCNPPARRRRYWRPSPVCCAV